MSCQNIAIKDRSCWYMSTWDRLSRNRSRLDNSKQVKLLTHWILLLPRESRWIKMENFYLGLECGPTQSYLCYKSILRPLSTVNIVWCSPQSWIITQGRLENAGVDEESISGNSSSMNVVSAARISAINESENCNKEKYFFPSNLTLAAWLQILQ